MKKVKLVWSIETEQSYPEDIDDNLAVEVFKKQEASMADETNRLRAQYAMAGITLTKARIEVSCGQKHIAKEYEF